VHRVGDQPRLYYDARSTNHQDLRVTSFTSLELFYLRQLARADAEDKNLNKFCSPYCRFGRGVTLTPHPLLVPWLRKSRAIPLLPLWAVRPVQSLSACTEPQCLYRASVPVQSLSACTEPQCLYRASVPIQSLSAYTEPQCLYRASVPVQSLSACTEPQCLYRASVPVQSLSAYTEPQCLYRASVPVQGCSLLFNCRFTLVVGTQVI